MAEYFLSQRNEAECKIVHPAGRLSTLFFPRYPFFLGAPHNVKSMQHTCHPLEFWWLLPIGNRSKAAARNSKLLLLMQGGKCHLASLLILINSELFLSTHAVYWKHMDGMLSAPARWWWRQSCKVAKEHSVLQNDQEDDQVQGLFLFLCCTGLQKFPWEVSRERKTLTSGRSYCFWSTDGNVVIWLWL